jgi:hypothetical protein
MYVVNFEAKGKDLFIDGNKVQKAWESWNGWYWFGVKRERTQDSLIGDRICKDDTIWYGLVQGFEEEWGYFSQAEIESLKPKTWEIKKVDLPYSGRRR